MAETMLQLTCLVVLLATVQGSKMAIRKHPCVHDGVLEVQCCLDNGKNEMLQIYDESSKTKVVAFTDPSGFSSFNARSYPDCTYRFESSCGILSVKNLLAGNLTIYCVIGSSVLEQFVEACPASDPGSVSNLNASNKVTSNENSYFTAFVAVCSIACVALVALAVAVVLICRQKHRRENCCYKGDYI